MSTLPFSSIGERESSNEKALSEERRQHIATFINDVLKPVDKTIQEEVDQINEVRAFESRPYQIEAWDALWTTREEGKDRGLIHLATGLGKTSVAVFDYARFRKEQEEKGGSARALFVVHQNAILDQADERFNEVLPHVLPSVGVSRFSNKADAIPSGEVVFASFQALDRGINKFPRDYFDYIVYDEAHHIEAKTYKKVVEYFTPKFQLGLTATPQRSDGKDITDHFGKAIYTKTLPEGIAEEYLADVHYRLMLDEDAKQFLQGGFKPKNMTELNKIFDFEAKPESVAGAIKVAQQEIRDKTGLDNVKTIIFSSDIAAADEMAQLIGGESYHSGSSGRKKKSVLGAFRSGKLETIVTRDMFNEGVDIPDARLIIFYRSTQSKTIFEQQLGRGLRKAEGKDEVTVLDFVANVERIRLVRELSDEVRKKRKPSAKGSCGSGTYGDLNINGDKTDFEFDQQVIDILALYGHFKEESNNRIDWSVWTDEDLIELARTIAGNVYLTRDEIGVLSKNGDFASASLITGRFGSVINFNKARGVELEFTNEDHIAVSALASQLGMGLKTLNDYLTILGVESREMMNAQGRVSQYVDLSNIDVIEQYHHKAELPNEGMVSLLDAAELLGRKPKTLEQVAAEKGMNPVYRRTSRNRLIRFFTQDEIAQIKVSLDESLAANNMLTLSQSLKAVRSNAKSFDEKAQELGIEFKLMRSSRGKMAKYYLPQDVEKIKEAISTPDPAPEDWASASAFQSMHNLTPTRFNSLCRQLSVETVTMLSSRGQRGKYLSPSQQALLTAVL